MVSGFKLAVAFIFAGPALLFGLKITLLGAYRGLIERKIPIGDEPATGMAALAIGLYALLMSAAIIFAMIYLVVWWLQ